MNNKLIVILIWLLLCKQTSLKIGANCSRIIQMKTLLTFFVLLFSSLVVADEGLIGKQLICQNSTDRSVSLRGIEFIDKENIKFVSGTYIVNENVNLKSYNYTYVQNLTKIKFFEYEKEIGKFILYRDTLELKKLPHQRVFFSCSLINSDNVNLNNKNEIINEIADIIEFVLSSKISIMKKLIKEKNKI